jgi:long-chain fatty acid transport protein
MLFAGGFQINEHGSRSMAMGGAFTAIVFDPSAIYFNSAALTRLPGFQFSLGTTLIAPNSTFRGPYGPTVNYPSIDEHKTKDAMFTPSHAYFTYEVMNSLYVGVGFNNPFGLGTEWDDNWVGRIVSIKADVKTFSLNPTVAYKVTDQLSLGVGLLYNWGEVTIKKSAGVALPPGPAFGEAVVSLSGKENSAFGFTAGVLYEPCKCFSLGASYHSQVEYNFTGTATSTGPAQFASLLPNGDISATLKSPAQLVVGAGYQVMDNLLAAFDFQYVWWSSYDSLKVDFANPALRDLASPREYKDTYILRLGLEYTCSYGIKWRGGLLYDKNPVTDELVDASLPDADRIGMSLGAGYQFTENIGVDLSYMFLRFKERTVSTSQVAYSPSGSAFFNGTYNSSASLTSLSLNFKF